MSGKSMYTIAKEIGRTIMSKIEDAIKSAPYTRQKDGKVISVENGTATVDMGDKIYSKIRILDGFSPQKNDIVIVIVPNNDISRAYILGKLSNFGG